MFKRLFNNKITRLTTQLLNNKPIRISTQTLGLCSVIYYIDSEYNAKTLQRTARTIYSGLLITYEYKFNFREGADIDKIHQRVAQVILECCQKNAGLFIKFGQSLASMNHILPPQYNETLKSLFKDAPSESFELVLKTFQEEFKCHPDDLFLEFERDPIASASVAQVHRARLKDGTPVAVKIQKHCIRNQIDIDLFSYKWILKIFQYLFDLPLEWTREEISSHLRSELLFLEEGKNAEKAQEAIQQCAQLRNRVYIPKVYWHVTSNRILTTEWIDGIGMGDLEGMRGNGIQAKEVMELLISTFAYQIFHSGFVHADPHPGNILVRKINNKLQICLLDHGLYVQESEDFRLKYCQFWKSLFLHDDLKLQQICHDWGIEDISLFASATLQKPYMKNQILHLNIQLSNRDLYQLQIKGKERIKKTLSDTQRIPRELIFVGRNLNLVRSHHLAYGNVFNRILLMADWAVRGLGYRGTLFEAFKDNRILDWCRSKWEYWWFRGRLLGMSLGYYVMMGVARVKEVWKKEEDLEKGVLVEQLKRKFGLELSPESFSA